MRLRERRNSHFHVSHLHYASLNRTQYELTVKVHRVFPSFCGQAASSPPLQFRRDPLRDSSFIVTTRTWVPSFGLFTLTSRLDLFALVTCHTLYVVFFNLAECCAFVKQSQSSIYCDRLSTAPLLPKLRGYFAEFLREVSLARLRILISPTCVGLRYGHIG